MGSAGLVHSLPGRLRVKVPALKGNADGCMGITDFLTGIGGVDKVTASQLTGSVVIYYDPDVRDSDNLLNVLYETGLFDPPELGMKAFFKRIGSKFMGEIFRSLFALVLKKTLERSGLAFIAAFI